MKVVYLAGPYRASSFLLVLRNILRAWRAAYKLWKAGYVVICPHMNTAWMSEWPFRIPGTTFLKGDLELVKRSDVVVLLPNWDESEGTMGEIGHAGIYGIPVHETVAGFLETEGRK